MSLIDLIIMIGTIGFIIFQQIKRNKVNNPNQNNYYNNTNKNNEKNLENKIKKFFDNFLSSGSYKNSNDNMSNFYFSKITLSRIVFITFIWLLSGFYIVQADQEGVVMRLGKYHTTTTPGLSYHLPYPIENVYKVKVTAINTEEIGYRSVTSQDDSSIYTESTMITKDENIVDVNFDVQWRIGNASEYLFNMRNNDISSTVRNISESVMREIIGNSNMFFVLGEGRAIIAEESRKMMQNIIDSYKIGIQILSIPIKKIDPPKQVIAAFRDVQSARADREREINMAQAYRNDVIPRAKGEAAQIVNQAESYYYQTVNSAKGEVTKMLSLYPMYVENKELTKIRLYNDLMENVFSNGKKVIVSGNGKNTSQNLNIMNIGDLMKNFTSQDESKK
jgi:membrane protease subunit HflK